MNRIRSWLAPTTPALLLVALGLLFFIDLVKNPGFLLFAPYSDLLTSFLPQRDFVVESFGKFGEIPLWNPYSFAGVPLVNDPEAGLFYPPHLLLFLLPRSLLGAGMCWMIVAHVIVAGLGGYAYSRDRGHSVLAAVVTGIGLMLSGKWLLHLLVAGHYTLIGFAWLPWIVLALERAIERASPSWSIAAAIAFALFVLGTHPQWAIFAVIFLAVWTRGATRDPAVPGKAPRPWARWLAITFLLAGGLVCLQALPTLEMVGYSTRASVGTTSTPAEKVDGFVATMMGLAGPPPTDEPLFLFRWERKGDWGFLWIFLAALGPWLDRREAVRRRTGLAGLLVLLTLAMGLIFPWLPGSALFNHPARMILFLALPAAYFAGITVQAVQTGVSLALPRAFAPWTAVILFPMLMGASLLSASNLSAISKHFVDYWLLAFVSTAASLTLLRHAAGRWSAPLLACLLLVDLWWLGSPKVQVIPPEVRYPAPECIRFLEDQEDDHGRVFTLGPHCSDPSPLGFGLGVLRRVERLGGYGPLDIYRYRWLIHLLSGMQGSSIGSQILAAIPVLHPSILDTLAVKYLLAPEDSRFRACSDTFDPLHAVAGNGTPAPWRKVFVDPLPRTYSGLVGQHVEFPPYAVYENPRFQGRAFWVGEAALLLEEGRRADQIMTNDYRQVVLLESREIVERARGRGGDGVTLEPEVTIESLSPNRVSVLVDSARDGFLVLADPWFPGWRAYVDGQETPLLRANVAMRAVELAAGSHRVVFEFAPISLDLGGAISAGTLLFCVGWLLVAALRRRAGPRLAGG